MGLGKVQAMGVGSFTLDMGALSPAGCRSRYDRDAGRGADVASEATLLRVTGGATGGSLANLLSVLTQEGPIRVALGRLEFRPNRQRARIPSERLDGTDLGCIHVTLGTEVLGMAGGTGRCDRACGAGQLPMLPGCKAGLAVGGRRWKIAY